MRVSEQTERLVKGAKDVLPLMKDELKNKILRKSGVCVALLNVCLFLFFEGKFCGRTVPDPVESSGNTMVVRFRSDHRLVSTGFKANYSRLVPTPTTPQPPTPPPPPATTTPGEIPFWLCLNWKGQRSWWLTEKYIYVRFEGKRKTREVVNPSLFVRWKQIKTFFKSKLKLFLEEPLSFFLPL